MMNGTQVLRGLLSGSGTASKGRELGLDMWNREPGKIAASNEATYIMQAEEAGDNQECC
jgi:hypothetical protein